MGDSDDDLFAKAVAMNLREVLDIRPGETLVMQTPQFERPDDADVGDPPLTPAAMDRLKQASEDELKALGLQPWSKESGLWLLPHEWHPHIPPEYPLQSILDEETTRSEMPAVPDKRFGMLSVGIVPEFARGETERDRDG